MSLELAGVHVYAKVNTHNGQSVYKLTRTNPYLRFGTETGCVFLQDGVVYSEEGGPIPYEKVPGWVTEEIAKTTKHALKECGWKGLDKLRQG